MINTRRGTIQIFWLSFCLVSVYLIFSDFEFGFLGAKSKSSPKFGIHKGLPHVQISKIVWNPSNLCQPLKTSKITLVIIVLSARENFLQRRLIRETWGSIRNFNNVTIAAVVFILGHIARPEEPEDTSSQLQSEFQEFNDIVSGDFVDSYRNLSLKSIMGYEWVSRFCAYPDILVKTDDDVMINIFRLTRELEITPIMESDAFWCYAHEEELPIRENTHGLEKYYVSYEEMAGEYFPKHCAGVGYLIRMNLVHKIVSVIEEEPHLVTHEDVYITGILKDRINNMVGNNDDIVRIENKTAGWYKYPMDEELTYTKLLNLSKNEGYTTQDVSEIFHKVYGTVLFFLIYHDDLYESQFRQVWERILMDTLKMDETSQG